ncbi:hypothetical protein [Timonella sp. A28]|uniref:hypothetical protein n=1 Tax=Timonella sp. A28 TaxID=3442640 RepID=UPI003EBFD78E
MAADKTVKPYVTVDEVFVRRRYPHASHKQQSSAERDYTTYMVERQASVDYVAWQQNQALARFTAEKEHAAQHTKMKALLAYLRITLIVLLLLIVLCTALTRAYVLCVLFAVVVVLTGYFLHRRWSHKRDEPVEYFLLRHSVIDQRHDAFTRQQTPNRRW